MSFSVNVHTLSSLIPSWEFIYILDLLHSLYIEPTWLNTRLVAFTSLTSICLIHGTLLKQGLRLQNTLGALKLIVLALIPVSGLLYLAGVKGIQVRDEYEKPNNFAWDKLWEGSGTGPGAFVNGLYNVIWYESFLFGTFYYVYFLLTSSPKVFHWLREYQLCTFGGPRSCTNHQTGGSYRHDLCRGRLLLHQHFLLRCRFQDRHTRKPTNCCVSNGQFVFIIVFFTQLLYRALYFRNLFGPTTERVSFSYYILHPRLLIPYAS